LTARGEPAKAIALLDSEPLRGSGRGPALPLARAQAYAAADRWQDAELASRAALAEAPDNLFARRQLAALLLRKNDAPGAEALIREGLRAQPADGQLQQTLVSLLQQAKGLEAALGVADELAKQPSAQPASRLLRGDLLLGAQRPADAARAFTAAYNEAPSVALALRRSAAFRAAGQNPEAVAALQAWLQREPDNPQVLDAMSQIDIQSGRIADAERRLNLVLEKAPNNGIALNNLAWILGERGGASAARARQLAERAYFLLPNAETADTLGWILIRTGADQKLATSLLRAAAAAPRGNQPANPTILYHLAYALNGAGDKAEAQKLLEATLNAAPSFPERAAAEKLLNDLKSGR
jgi:predicted Zn-dependent protease